MFKRFFTLLICLFIIFTFSVPVFAGTGPDNDGIPIGYSPAGYHDQVDAFRSYCKSRNLVIEGSALDTITHVTSSIYQRLVADAGLDINQLQNEIYKNTKDNVGAKWFFTTTGIAAYNRLFSELLQNNDLSVGETVNNKNIYKGDLYTDADGNSCLVWDMPSVTNNSPGYTPNKYGTTYKYNGYDIKDLYDSGQTSISFTGSRLNGSDYTISKSILFYSNHYDASDDVQFSNIYKSNASFSNYFYSIFYANSDAYGTYSCQCIAYHVNGGSKLYIGSYIDCRNYKVSKEVWNSFEVYDYPANITPNQTVYYTTNNTIINNNNYEGDTYITNEGDVINNNPAPGGKDPGWDVGGGQGSYDDGNGNSYTINFPDFELPDLNIDWSIQGLGNKFPFSIPFDIASLISVLNAEPEAPRFQGTMDLGITTYNYDIDLAQFDTVASACRIAELLLLVFGLIMITRSIIKG